MLFDSFFAILTKQFSRDLLLIKLVFEHQEWRGDVLGKHINIPALSLYRLLLGRACMGYGVVFVCLFLDAANPFRKDKGKCRETTPSTSK